MRMPVLLLLGSLIAGSAAAGPQFHIVNDTHNFGQVPEGVFLTHTFWVKSVGDQPLRILAVDAGCSCTEVPLPDSVAQPGDSLPVQIILRTRRLTGNVAKRPEFYTNAETPKGVLKFYADVKPDTETMAPLVIRPAKVDVSQFGEKPRRRAKFWIYNPTDQAHAVTIIDTVYKSFTVKMPAEIPARDSSEVTVIVKDEAAPTAFEESFTFEVVADGYPRYSVPISRIYKGKSSLAKPSVSGTSQ